MPQTDCPPPRQHPSREHDTKLSDVRRQFAITRRSFLNPRGVERAIVYLDHGASTHPPAPVLDVYREFLESSYANVHRGNHHLSRRASSLYDEVSSIVLRFLGADADRNGVVFTSNTTTALDIASHLVSAEPGAVLVSGMEHHSNDLPHRRRGEVRRIQMLGDGTLDYADLQERLATERIKLVALTGASNVTGYTPDLHRVARLAHAHGARVLVDAAQLLAHRRIAVGPNHADDHIDFVAAAGHKTYAPFGAAFLMAPSEALRRADPYIPGGGTVKFVSDKDAVFVDDAGRHCPGTPNIAGVIALGAALEWLSAIGLDWVAEHERALLASMESGLRAIPGVRVLGRVEAPRKIGVVSFVVEGWSYERAAEVLDSDFGVAVRHGCFCAQPYISRLLGVVDPARIARQLRAGEQPEMPGAVRATIGIYNTSDDVEMLVRGVTYLGARPD